VTSLKIKYNPFAKAFLDAKERPETTFARENSSYWIFQNNQATYLNPDKYNTTNRNNHRSTPYTKPLQHATRSTSKLSPSPIQTPPCENSGPSKNQDRS
jgi:hypothetical protein